MRELLGPPLPGWRGEKLERPVRRPVITISRLPGAGGAQLAKELARRLDLEVHDRDIIHRIAVQVGLADRAVRGLEEEQEHSLLTEWLASFASDSHLAPYGYLQHLRRVVEGIARLGGAVILGRGAHLILPPGGALRVFVVAPLQARVATVMERYGADAGEAERQIRAKEAERRAFLQRYFQSDLGDPASYDMVVNTSRLGVRGAADAIEACLPAARLAAHA
jgi:cytidylate kinase